MAGHTDTCRRPAPAPATPGSPIEEPPTTVEQMSTSTEPGARRRSGRTPRTLAEALRRWDDDALTVLLLARPDLARPLPADSTQVASRAATRLSVNAALERLDAFHLGVCEALVLVEAPVGATAVRRVVHAPARSVTATLARLRALALVWGADSDLQVVRAVGEVLGPHPAGLGAPLRTALRSVSTSRLRGITRDVAATVGGEWADRSGWQVEEVADLVAANVPALLDAAQKAAPGTAEVLARLTWGPPAGRLGGVRSELSLSDAQGPVEHLLALGLLVGVDARTVLLPREVALHLRGGRLTEARADRPPSAEPVPRDAAIVERTAAGTAYEAVRQVEHLMDEWSVHPPAVLRAGGLGVRDLRLAASVLEVDEEQAGFWAELAQLAGLAGRGSDDELDPVWLPTRAYDAWLTDDVAQRWVHLVSAWLDSDRATALVGTRDERDRPVNPLAPDLHRASVPEVRRAALSVLAEHENAAVPEADVLATVAWRRPRRAALRDATVRRTMHEAGWLGVTGAGALSLVGRLLLGSDSAGSVADALRRVLPDPGTEVVLQADLTAVAPGPLERDVARSMALLADVESRGGATVYRFSAGSLRRALDAGWTGAEVHAFLQERSRTPVPQPLGYLVDDIARRHGHLRIGPAAVYLRSEDPRELDSLVADRSLAGLGMRRLSPTVAVSDSPANVVLGRLRSTSRAPVVEGPDGVVRLHEEPATRRAPAPPPTRPATTVLAATEAEAVAAAVRTGDRAAVARPPGAGGAQLQRSGSLDAVAALREAAQSGVSVWLAYLDQAGTLTERIVDPVRVEAGRLTALDHRSGRTQDFALHRVSRVGPA